MNEREELNRRDFLKKSVVRTGLAAITGSLLGSTVLRATADEPAAPPAPPAAEEMPKVKHRRLGRTNIEISELAAPGDTLHDFVMFMLAVNAGVNYYHKAEGTFSNPRNREVPLKDREKFYLDVVIDNLEENAAYEEFESKRKRIGSEYVDFFKVHSTWKTPEDFQTQRGVLAAYDRLKKEKKVRWLALSKHNPNTTEVLTAALETGMFDAIQPAVSHIGEFEKILKLAQSKGTGVICMKTNAIAAGRKPELSKFGDPNKPYQTYYRYLLSLDGVTGIVSNFKNFDQMRENLSSSGAPRMEKSEIDAISYALLNAPRNYRDCITCGHCRANCPDGLAVDDVMRFRMYAEDYGDRDIARAHYEKLPANWKATLASGKGVTDATCPYGLPLAAELKQAHRWLA
jgi:predicted aldo/keto reductase-like oxidoreductase